MSFLKQFDKYKASQNTALVCGDVSLSYAELHKHCSALARVLRSRGVGVCSTAPDCYDIFDPKAAHHSPWAVIITERSVNAVIGAIAAWMAGGAYVLLGADAPEAYIGGILEDTAAVVVLRDSGFSLQETDAAFEYTFPDENEIACAVFTSGSTGRPKGAALEHRVINEMLRWQTENMKPDSLAATAAYAPFGFIASLWELFFPLANGLTLHILNDTVRRDLFALESYIETHNIAYTFLPPNIAEVFTGTYKGKALKYLRVAGGRLKSCSNPSGYEMLYSLGMAENGGCVTFKSIRNAMDGDIPIGKPWGNTKVYLAGDSGEMAVSGPSLFRGYLSRRAETQEKLVNNPYSSEPGYEMMYLSGDLAQTVDNGELIHKGRVDWTVKIRDMKVNPSQVESALCECTGVADCCVTAQMHSGDIILIGWVTGSVSEESLKTDLSARLPEHMIPSVFIVKDELPRNINGKIDKHALIYSPPNAESGARGALSPAAGIAALFERVLGRPVSDDDNFLALGGDSLKFMKLQAEIAREFSQNIPYSVLSANPTPRLISGLLQQQNHLIHIPHAMPMDAYPLSGPMRQMWLLWKTGQDGGKYTVSIQCRFQGEINEQRVIAAFRELIRRNAILRSYFIERGEDVFQVVGEHAVVSISSKARHEFDLSSAPLFDITIGENILGFTTHHIISDAAGLRNLIDDFWTIYGGGEPLDTAQAHDVTMWALGRDLSADKEYWHKALSVDTPAFSLPHDYLRPSRFTTAARDTVYLTEPDIARLREYAASQGTTLFQLFLAAYALLLSKLSGCGSITIGVPFSGREHPDTQRTIGMLVKTLPVILDVSGMSFKDTLVHVRERFTEVWEHQGISLEQLAEMNTSARSASRSPFYDVMINYVPLPDPLPDIDELRPEIQRSEYPGALFDLVLDVQEEADGFSAVFTYSDELFRAETIRNWADAFKTLLLTGKIDIKLVNHSVPSPNKSHTFFDEASPQSVALLDAWKEVLDTDTALPGDNFFTAGGTSLAAIRLEASLFSRGWLLSAADIFQNPTLCEMAALMSPADEIDWEAEA